MKQIGLVIADDHTLLRDGMRALLDSTDGIKVVAEANDGLEVMEQVKKHQPDVVLMDIGMPRMNGLDATKLITQNYSNTRVLIISMHANEEYVLRALRAGAAGYILKESRKQELLHAIETVASGGTYLSPKVSRHVIDNYVQSVGAHKSPLEKLTPRQRETLKLIAEGRSSREIASMLDLSIKTVETHRTQLMERLDIHDVAGLVRFAIKSGLATVSD
ncbi:MAG TPA: response regulator transcription factor [Acidobacteriota bacterium]